MSIIQYLASAQVVQQWVSRYNGPLNGWDDSRDIVLDKQGNVYVTGYSDGSQSTDYLTVKYNSLGIQQWAARYLANGWAYTIAIDDSANILVSGFTGMQNTGQDITTVKYSSGGSQIWSVTYNGNDNGDDVGWENITDSRGNVYITGWSWSLNGDDDFITIKYNSAGVQQWASRYNSPGNLQDRARDIALDDSGNVYVTGCITGQGGEGATIKYNSAGVQQWVTRTTSLPNVYLYSVAVDRFGSVYVNGWYGTTNQEDYLTIKYSAQGIQQWAVPYNGTANAGDQSRWMVLDDSANVYVTGTSNQLSISECFTTIKYSTGGVQRWASSYSSYIQSGISCGFVRGIALDSSFNVYVTGYGCVPSGGTFDFATIKYNNSGVQKWAITYNGTGDSSDYGWAIAVDGYNNVYVTGASFGNGSGEDFATVKYSQPIGIRSVTGKITEKFLLFQNYPNPFNPVTNIKFDIPVDSKGSPIWVKLIVYDILGKEIVKLVDGELAAGSYEAEWDASDYPSGLYFLRFSAGDYSNTKKMMLVK